MPSSGISPHYYAVLCDPPAQQKPCMLLPPLDERIRWEAGHDFFFEITLVGSVAEYFPVCRDAVESLGKDLGFGSNRGKFDMLRIEEASFQPGNEAQECKGLTLRYITNLRIKDRGKLVRSPPSFAVFFSRLLGRLNSLALFYGNGPLYNRKEKADLLEWSEKIKLDGADACWSDWSRFSGSQKQWMTFGGLAGAVTYAGNLAPFLPWLALGEWAHIGGKTSFGLGKYQMEIFP